MEPKLIKPAYHPSEYDHIELLSRIEGKYDIMRAWNENWAELNCDVYLGFWNDGFVGEQNK